MRKAYKIVTKADGHEDYGIYSAESAGKAKTNCVFNLKDLWRDANYSWIKSCRRYPAMDELANKYPGCIAWKQGY